MKVWRLFMGMKTIKTMTRKQPKLQDFLNQGENKGHPNPNLDHETKTKMQHMLNKNPRRFYCRKKKKKKTRL